MKTFRKTLEATMAKMDGHSRLLLGWYVRQAVFNQFSAVVGQCVERGVRRPMAEPFWSVIVPLKEHMGIQVRFDE